MSRQAEPQEEQEPQRRVLRMAAWLPPQDRDYATETSFWIDNTRTILLCELRIEHVWGDEKARLKALFSTKPRESAPDTKSTPISFRDLKGTDLYMRIMTTLGSNIDLTPTGEDGPLCVSVRPPFTMAIEDFLGIALDAADWLNRQLHAPFQKWFTSMTLHVCHQCLLTHVGGTDAAVWVDAGIYALWQRNLISDVVAAVPREIPPS